MRALLTFGKVNIGLRKTTGVYRWVLWLLLVACGCEAEAQQRTHITRIDEAETRYFSPEGIVYVQGDRATLCDPAANTAYLLTGVDDSVCRVVQLPDIPIDIYDDIVRQVNTRSQYSGVTALRSEEVLPLVSELGCDHTSPYVAPRFQQVSIVDDSTIIALGRVHVACYVTWFPRATWDPTIILARLRRSDMRWSRVYTLPEDTLRPYVQDVTMLIRRNGALICSTFDTKRFGDPRPDSTVVAEKFDTTGRNLGPTYYCLPADISRRTGYRGWLEGFVACGDRIALVNANSGQVVALSVSDDGLPPVVSTELLPTDSGRAVKGRYCQGVAVEGDPNALIVLCRQAVDSTGDSYTLASHLARITAGGVVVTAVDTRTITRGERMLVPFYRARTEGRRRILRESRWVLRGDTWFIEHHDRVMP